MHFLEKPQITTAIIFTCPLTSQFRIISFQCRLKPCATTRTPATATAVSISRDSRETQNMNRNESELRVKPKAESSTLLNEF